MSGSCLAQRVVNLAQIGRGLLKVVITDDPLRLAEAGNRGGDVFLQIDILHAFGDGGPQQQLPFVFALVHFRRLFAGGR